MLDWLRTVVERWWELICWLAGGPERPTFKPFAGTWAISDHSARHEDTGADEISVASLSGVLADKQDADKLQGRAINSGAPSDGEILAWDNTGSEWAPADKIKGEDQVFSYKDKLQIYVDGADGADDAESGAVPSGEVWVVTWMGFRTTDATPGWWGMEFYNGTDWRKIITFPESENDQYKMHGWHTELYLEAGDKIRASGTISAGSKVQLVAYGYKMSKET